MARLTVRQAFCVSLSGAAPARAQTEDRAAARALFEEGRRLLATEGFDAACPKFEAARQLALSTGVLLNLADCHEHFGRTASAWSTLGDAVPVAERAQRHEDAVEAKRRQNALAQHLVRLVIHVAAQTPRLTVTRDGIEVPRAAWDTAIPVDPGTHEVRAEAPGHKPWLRSIALTAEGRTTTVEIEINGEVAAPPPQTPVTAAVPAATSAAPSTAIDVAASEPPADGVRSGRTQRLLGLIAGGAGVVTMGVGGVLGLVAKAQDDAARDAPWPAKHDDSVGAANLGDAATIVALVGAGVTAAGVIVWLTAPKAHAEVGTNGRELFLRGTF